MREKNLEKSFISAVVYVRNHQFYLENFMNGLVNELKLNFEKIEIIFVNDYSVDNSVQIIKNIAKDLKDITISIINLSFYQGLEAGIVAGVDVAIGDFVFEFDSPIADFDFEEVMKVYYQSLKGYDIVSSSPDKREKFASKIFYKIFKKYSKNNLQLHTERFRILTRRGINRIKILSKSIPYRKALYFNCGLKSITLKYRPINLIIPISELAITNEENYPRKSILQRFSIPNIPFKFDKDGFERTELAINSLLLFTNFWSQLAFYMALVMFFISFFMISYTLHVYFYFQKVAEGWTTIMLFISIAFTGLFALVAILIKYVSLMLSMQHNKHDYVFESVEKLKQ